MKCVICSIAKQENAYLYEWAEYHIELGFSHIYLYDNNDVNGENPAMVFEGTQIEKYITIIDVRGKKYWQLSAYQHCADSFKYDWCAFIDIDEFITFADDEIQTISDFLSRFPDIIHAVHLNWLCYGDCGHIHKQKQILSQYRKTIKPIDFCFTYDDIEENAHIKSIIRGGVCCEWRNNENDFRVTPHTPYMRGIVANNRGG